MIELTLTEKAIPSGGPYTKYFDYFNLVQSTLLENGIPDKDCNLVLGTATSTGKTISSEFFVMTTLAQKKKVIYVAPMKALASEKYEEWKERFSQYRTEIITGDYKHKANDPRFEEAHIIIMTSEMLDSKTRGLRNSESWIRHTGLLIIDEAHIMGTESRGSAAEAGIVRLSRYVPEARVVLLSATMPNSDEFGKWLENINGKETFILNTTWRPVPLRWRFYQLPKAWKYAERISNTVAAAVSTVQSCLPQKCLCFVHDKKSGNLLVKALKKAGIESRFHSADLDMKQRASIESSFRLPNGKGLDVIVATSTIAWGSVAVGTSILTPHGPTNSIESLQVGSPVMSVNEDTGLLEEDRISSYVEHESTESYEVELEDGRSVIVDYKHPFYLKTGDIIEAKSLKIGDDIYVGQDFKTDRVPDLWPKIFNLIQSHPDEA